MMIVNYDVAACLGLTVNTSQTLALSIVTIVCLCFLCLFVVVVFALAVSLKEQQCRGIGLVLFCSFQLITLHNLSENRKKSLKKQSK